MSEQTKPLFPFLARAGKDWGEPAGYGSELPGVRDSMARLIDQEIRGGRSKEVVEREVKKIVNDYHHGVLSGKMPQPVKK